MFDSKEISKRALIRTYELKAQKKRFKAVTSIIKICFAVSAVIMITIFSVFYKSMNYEEYVIEPNETPLYGFQFSINDEPDYLLRNSNKNPCTFEIILSDTGETVYISDIIAPDMSVDEIVLVRNLEKGNYQAYLIIHEYESPDEIDSFEISFSLVIE